MAKALLLDTSAMLTLVDAEPGCDRVETLLRAGQRGQVSLLACFISLVEVRYITLQERGWADADTVLGFVKSWPLRWIYPDETVCLLAARFKAEHRLSLADALIAATAKLQGAALVHKDPEYDALAAELALESLPRKR